VESSWPWSGNQEAKNTMSRIGKMPVEVPKGVDVTLDGKSFTAKGPKGTLSMEVHPEIEVQVDGGAVMVTRPSDQPRHRALHGLTRSLLANMVTGVSEGFSKTLEIVGVGYRAEPTDTGLKIQVGYSHPIDYPAPEGITLTCPNQTTIVVSGADKQQVGQSAAKIRSFRPPEPYKGKGIRYQGEHVRRKAGKTAGA
jgi:large subunit ribosomal protein L6